MAMARCSIGRLAYKVYIAVRTSALSECAAALLEAVQAEPLDAAAVEPLLLQLEQARMTVELLQATGAGKAVNKLKKAAAATAAPLGERATVLVGKWKGLL